ISWDSTDDELNNLSDNNYENIKKSTVASRTRSHTPSHYHSDKKQTRNSPNGKRTTNHINGSTKRYLFDQNDECVSRSGSTSTPKMNRMLTRHQIVVQQTSPNKKRKLNSNSNSNSIDDQNYSIN
ncbi:unnamed protein product, partial [Rotaria magnacalcarata]